MSTVSLPPDLHTGLPSDRLLVRPPNELTAAEAGTLRHPLQDGEAARVTSLVQRFATLLRDRAADGSTVQSAFDRWLDDARASGVRAVETFAQGLAQGGAAGCAAPIMSWSNGRTQEQITKFKLLKR